MGLSRTVWRYQAPRRDDETPLRAEIIRLASQYGHYGYRMIEGLMRNAGWILATPDRVRRIWKEEGLKVPDKQTLRGRLWLNDGSCLRLSMQSKVAEILAPLKLSFLKQHLRNCHRKTLNELSVKY